MENLTYRNIDILDHREMQVDYQGCLAINAGDNNLVRNVRFENIRIENFRQGPISESAYIYNKKYCKAPGRGIENVLFKDITYNGNHAELSHIVGYDEERMVKNIRFENLKINGKVYRMIWPASLHGIKRRTWRVLCWRICRWYCICKIKKAILSSKSFKKRIN